jgi:hypothetical protein
MNKKNGFVINPLTQRPIKIGGRVYKELLKSGYIEGTTNINTPKYKLKEQFKQSKQIDSDNDSEISLININDEVYEEDEEDEEDDEEDEED